MNRTKAMSLAGVAAVIALAGTPGASEAQVGAAISQPSLTNAPAAAPALAAAAPSASTNSTPPIPNSDSNYLDDKLNWDVPIHVYPMGAKGIDLSSTYCLPASVTVTGLDFKYTTATPPNTTTTQNYLPVKLDDPRFKGKRLDAKLQDPSQPMCDNLAATAATTAAPALTVALPIYDDTQFYVGGSDLDHTATRSGWDFGTLIVPFKFQMSDKSLVTGSATLGGYVGYNIGLNMPGFRVSPVAFVGVSDISMPQSGGSGSSSSTQTVAGISYGVGLMGTIKDSFNISLVFGADHASSNNYQYQDKPWVSFALGYSFTK
jgi:hypothetical protein